MPADRKVYLDLSFWQDLEKDLGASGEAARAYVIAHGQILEEGTPTQIAGSERARRVYLGERFRLHDGAT